MTNELKQHPYGRYSVIAFIVIGYTTALISPWDNYNLSLLWVLAVFTMFMVGLAISLLGFKQSKTVEGKLAFMVLAAFYVTWIILLVGVDGVKFR